MVGDPYTGLSRAVVESILRVVRVPLKAANVDGKPLLTIGDNTPGGFDLM